MDTVTPKRALRNCWKVCQIVYLNDETTPEFIRMMVDHMKSLDAAAIQKWADDRLALIEDRLIKAHGYTRQTAKDVLKYVDHQFDRQPVPNEILRQRIMAR